MGVDFTIAAWQARREFSSPSISLLSSCEFLVLLAICDCVPQTAGTDFEYQEAGIKAVAQSQLAEWCDLSREFVARTLQKLERLGLIRRHGQSSRKGRGA